MSEHTKEPKCGCLMYHKDGEVSICQEGCVVATSQADLNPSAYRAVVEALRDALTALKHPEDHAWAEQRIRAALRLAEQEGTT